MSDENSLFKRAYRVEIGAAIAREPDPGVVCGKELISRQGLKVDKSRVSEELRDLVGAGLLEAEDPSPNDRRRFYRRITSAYWRLCQELEERADQTG